jgi:hypothetical protein
MRYLLVAVLFVFAGCTTIHFDNGETSGTVSTQSAEWHHNWALDLYEGSAPVDVEEVCGENGWSSVKTERSFTQGLASFVANFMAPIWYPKTAEVVCK